MYVCMHACINSLSFPPLPPSLSLSLSLTLSPSLCLPPCLDKEF